MISGVRTVDWGIKQDEEKIWTIDQIDRKKFKCFGIQVLSITGKNHAAIQDLKMWKGESSKDWAIEMGLYVLGVENRSSFRAIRYIIPKKVELSILFFEPYQILMFFGQRPVEDNDPCSPLGPPTWL